MSNQHTCNWMLTVLTVPRHPAEEASSDPREAVAEDDAVADGVAIVERAYRVAVTLRSHSAEAVVAVEYSLSFLLVLCAAYPTPAWHKDAEDNAVEASSRARDSWWTLHSGCNIRLRPAMLPASVLQANSRLVSAAAVAVDPRSMMRAS